ncbi:hypothetical protein FrEUN1fDRAFT_6093 [Parafrankia sp. EUN1f]|nr:hypothetical protein FrEUN1fDRAFT_6093 [Parafrankia sp. EUN1f]
MTQARGQRIRWLVGVLAVALLFGVCEGSGSSGDPARPSGQAAGIPAPPKPEPIDLTEYAAGSPSAVARYGESEEWRILVVLTPVAESRASGWRLLAGKC